MEVFNNGLSNGLEQARSWAMQFVHWFASFWEWTFLIDIAGLSLAVIGLFNLGPKLQRWSETVVDYAQYYERYVLTDLRAIWPLSRSWWYLMKLAVKETWEWWLIVPFSFWISGFWWMLIGFLSAFPLWAIVLFVLTYPFTALIVWMLFHVTTATTGIIIANVIWRLCLILNFPPSGIIGGIGLVITFISVVTNRLN